LNQQTKDRKVEWKWQRILKVGKERFGENEKFKSKNVKEQPKGKSDVSKSTALVISSVKRALPKAKH